MGVQSGPPPPLSRNLTSIFLRYRHDRRTLRGSGKGEHVGQRLLNTDLERGTGEVALEMTALPPQWVESAEEAKECVKQLREKLIQLTKAQQKRLLKIFGDDKSPDKEVNSISSQISTLVRKCEQLIHQVKTRGGAALSGKDQEFRKNVQRNLAEQLQQLSRQFRTSQEDYMTEIKKRRKGGALFDDVVDSSSARAVQDLGFSDGQLRELEDMEQSANQRTNEITQIASSISDLHTIFKELAVLVIDQGSILDRIDYNIEQVVAQSGEATEQLNKAQKAMKSNRAMRCILILVAINVILILILIVKART